MSLPSLQSIRDQLPHLHPYEAGAGGLAGLLSAYLYHKGRGWLGGEKFRDSDQENWTLLKRLAGGAVLGAGTSNIVADRLRRYVSNMPKPEGYNGKKHLDSVKALGLKGLWKGAVLDEPLPLVSKTDDGNTVVPMHATHRNMRRELLRRGLNVHWDKPREDWFRLSGYSAGGYPVLGFSDRWFDPRNQQMKPEFKDVFAQFVAPNYTPKSGQGLPTGQWAGDYSHLLGKMALRPFGDTFQMYDRWDFNLHKHEQQFLKDQLRTLANAFWTNPDKTTIPREAKLILKDDTFITQAMRALLDKTLLSKMPAVLTTLNRTERDPLPGESRQRQFLGEPHRVPSFAEAQYSDR